MVDTKTLLIVEHGWYWNIVDIGFAIHTDIIAFKFSSQVIIFYKKDLI